MTPMPSLPISLTRHRWPFTSMVVGKISAVRSLFRFPGGFLFMAQIPSGPGRSGRISRLSGPEEKAFRITAAPEGRRRFSGKMKPAAAVEG
jgi:hypothetical protein